MNEAATAEAIETPLRLLFLGEDSLTTNSLLDSLEHLPFCGEVHHLSDQDLLDKAIVRLEPDLVLVDFGISEESRRTYIPGLLMRRLREQTVIAVTSAEREYRGIAAVQLGAQDYLCVDHQRGLDLEDTLRQAVRRNDFFERLSQPEHSVRSILHTINDGVMVIDRDGLVISLNPAGRRILGLSGRDWPDAEWCRQFCRHDADTGEPLQSADTPLSRALDGARFTALEVRHKSDDQPDLILSISGQGLMADDGSLIGAVLTFRDATERYRQSAELTRLSSYDSLTGLANRRFFEEHLEKALGRARRASRTLSLLFIDLDRFKSVNDTLGHDVGDALLCEVARRLTDELRVGDFIARWGGDEFIVALENVASSRDAAAVAQKLCLALAEKYELIGRELYVTPSIGIAQYPSCGENRGELIKAADAAMYQAKRRGTGRFQFYSKGLNESLSENDELEVGLRHALVRREFALHYQPRIDAGSGRLIGLEALLRWQHPRFGLLAPARFLAILESSGLIHSVGEWVIDEACRQLSSWQQRYNQPDLSVTVNLSPQQLTGARLVDAVAKSLADTALDPGCLELEVGEATLSDRRSGPIEALAGLRGLGVRVSVDHFGTRDISFRSLDQGVVDTFVLHQSLIQDLDSNPGHQRIVRAAIAMAQGLDIEVGAEGIETMAQFEYLQECRCNILQGHLISRPLQADAIGALLRARPNGFQLS
ncbi:MAG: EAL domain-containing protein [Pseudomonadota bacterium]